MSTLARVL